VLPSGAPARLDGVRRPGEIGDRGWVLWSCDSNPSPGLRANGAVLGVEITPAGRGKEAATAQVRSSRAGMEEVKPGGEDGIHLVGLAELKSGNPA